MMNYKSLLLNKKVINKLWTILTSCRRVRGDTLRGANRTE